MVRSCDHVIFVCVSTFMLCFIDRPQTAAELRAAGENIKPRKRLALAKGAVKFLADEDSKVLEFWQIWSESIPAREEVPPYASLACLRVFVCLFMVYFSRALCFFACVSTHHSIVFLTCFFLSRGMFMEFHVAVSADLQKLTWRTAGPQNVFIQRMVDFFWNVGAPESEVPLLYSLTPPAGSFCGVRGALPDAPSL